MVMEVQETLKIHKKWVNMDYEFVIYELMERGILLASSTLYAKTSVETTTRDSFSPFSDPVPELISSIFIPKDTMESNRADGNQTDVLIKEGILVKVQYSLIRVPNQPPYLAFESDQQDHPLSISHTRNTTLLACTRTAKPIGVDLEYHSRTVSERLMDRMLSSEEKSLSEISDFPPVQIWTIKEAALKWAGTGLRTAMNTLTIRPNNRTTLTDSVSNPTSSSHPDPTTNPSLHHPIHINSFNVLFSNEKRVEVRSFRLDDFWVSLAFSE